MKGSKDVLSSVIKTAQMGQIGIRSVLNAPLRAGLKDALRSQLREYDAMSERHWNWLVPEAGPLSSWILQ